MATVHFLAKAAIIAGAAAATVPALLDAAERASFDDAVSPAIRIDQPRSVDGLRLRAQQALNAGRYADADAAARAVIARAPLNRPAVRILAMARSAQDQELEAAELLIAASVVTWRDPYTQTYLYGLASRADEPDAASRRADALARNAEFRTDGFAALTELLDRPGGADAVATRLALRPDWRAYYFAQLTPHTPEQARAIADLMRRLRRSAAPPTSTETAEVLTRLVAAGSGRLAYDLWDGRARDDPDFQSMQVPQPGAAAQPFAWSFASDTPVRLVDRRDEAGRPALVVEPTDERAPFFVSRLVPVAPGRYVLSYRASGSSDALDRLHPRVECNGTAVAPADLAPSRGQAGGSLRSQSLRVPAGCEMLRLGFGFETGGNASTAPVAIRAVTLTRAQSGQDSDAPE
jgi:hypothetical protein